MNIPNSVFVITGGASGLGAAVARTVVARGGKVMLLDIREEPLTAFANELGANAAFAVVDVTNDVQCQTAIAATSSTFGRIDALVNCAGIELGARVVGREGPHDLEKFSRTIAVNLIGSFNMIRLAADAMSKQKPLEGGERGVIINTASIAAFDGQIGQAAYAASKSGIVGMTLPIARELARFGIRVMTIAPGIFKTPMVSGMSAEVQASLASNVPFPPRFGEPEEFASLVCHVVENMMLNGEVIRLDGAVRMAAR
ncbi:putative enzyme [Paraburkholderia piptadeniae]|uniref:Enzyme n=1 Tax=Paraburkholderia piptadeniae TaxID=1701573 RepID=A0A1N7RIV7_9BURK|nr:3-hydroxyacyl-CoA dehydrogenase [Paraburkholderia piptadeniae]SIT34984.1 putative enzyme [Paraburkholderia piptadeniae]